MKNKLFKRIVSLVITICLLLTVMPLSFPVDVEAVTGINSLTCSGFISNATARSYIDTMMRYYINSSTTLQNTLNNGRSVVFMFEGGSDNYWGGSDYTNSAYDTRNQAVCIVVRMDSSGAAKIVFYCENCTSVPGMPTDCTNGVAYSGSTTLMDGTYSFFTHNHTGPYAAFQINLTNSNGYCYYTPSDNLNGYQAGASGINIHTRSTNIAGGSPLTWAWSEGCQVIGNGGDVSNEFNAFMKATCDITWNPWINWTNKTLNTWSSANLGIYKGYYVLDRQLALTNASGTEYGSGSLINLYNKTALTNITAKSTAAREAAGATTTGDYVSKCTYYPCYGTISANADSTWSMSLPCYSGVDSTTAYISVYSAGENITATGLYKNTIGEYWYRTINRAGGIAYIRADNVTFVDDITTDITIKDHTPPNGHVQGNGSVIDGVVSTTYNQLTAVSAYVYTGFGTYGTQVTGTRDTSSNNSYTLSGSTVDNGVWMNVMDTGNHTLAITAEYKNCYITNGSTLNTNTGSIVVAEDYFMVIPSSVSQSSCSHTYQTYPVGSSGGDCTSTVKTLKACTICGLTGTVTTSSGSHSYGDWVTTPGTCTTEGTKTRTCTVCGAKETTSTGITGHKYSSVTIPATCQDYEKITYTCSVCNDTYTEYKDAPTEWSETKPEGVEESRIETKTQYRYSDYSTITSPEPSVDGYTLINSEWIKNSDGTVYYVPSWPSGFDKTSSIYNEYNGTKKTASQNYYTKTEINSDAVCGYLYYHWCAPNSYYSYASSTGSYTTFHAYYATANPSNYECDTSDMSYKTSNTACCTNSNWYFVATVYAQNYSTYTAQYTHSIWSEFSEWSDTPATAAWNKKVETRTLYRIKSTGELGDHVYVDGVCSLCGKAKPDYHLFGFINGANYACEEDSSNIGTYKFTDGKLSAKFTEDSYVAVKTSDNEKWFMTDGYPGNDATSATLYNTSLGINAEKLFVPKGRVANFSLTENSDGTLTLSYTLDDCTHDNHNTDGICTICNEKVSHNYVNDVCTICGKNVPTYYLAGFINGADYGIGDDSQTIGTYKFTDGTLKTTFTHDSYVMLKTGDNSIWYNCDGYPGEDATSALFYNSALLGDNADKLFVPKGREITFTLTDNGDETFTLSYTAAECTHPSHDTNGICTTCSEEVGHTSIDGICTICGYNCDHNYVGDTCTICGKERPQYYLFGFINGADYDALDYRFTDGTLKVTFTHDSYIALRTGDGSKRYMTNGYLGQVTTATLYNADDITSDDKLFVPKGREITFTLVDNGDDSFTLSYTAADCTHPSHDINGICTTCSEEVGHTNVDGVCTICGYNCPHNYVDDICTICGKEKPVFYLFGYINGADYDAYDYKITDGTLSTSFSEDSYIAVKSSDGTIRYMTDGYQEGATTVTLYNAEDITTEDKLFVPKDRDITFTLIDNKDGTLTLSYALGACEHISHDTDGICSSCGSQVPHTYKDGSCTICGLVCQHNYQGGYCTICSYKDPGYYLVGYINGSNYGIEQNSSNLGIYKFTGESLVAVFNQNSYVVVKSGDNQNLYMAETYPGNEATSATLYNTKTGNYTEKLFVPKGRLITFTLTKNTDGTLTLSYVAAPCSHTTHTADGICTTCGEEVNHSYQNGSCTICQHTCPHYWAEGTCTVCGISCTDHIWVQGECCLCGISCNHSFSDDECTVCGLICTHSSYTEGKCDTCHASCNHTWSDSKCTTCGTVCTHNFTEGTCQTCGKVCVHSFANGVCQLCRYSCKHSFNDGECTICGVICDHNFSDCTCTDCGLRCTHSFSNNACTICGHSMQFYLVGNINGTQIGYDANYAETGIYKFTDGKLTLTLTEASQVFVKASDNLDWFMTDSTAVSNSVTLYNTRTGKGDSMLLLPAGVDVTLSLTENSDGTLTLSYTTANCQHLVHNRNGICTICAAETDHTYEDETCTVCGKVQLVYYLIGNINGTNCGYNENASLSGGYKFTDGKLTVTFTKDSYVAVKTGDNLNWYMTDGEQGTVPTATLYNTMIYDIDAGLLFVPANTRVTFSLSDNKDETLTISYETAAPAPVLKPQYTVLNCENELRYDVYFTVSNPGSLSCEDIGLIILNEGDTDGTVADAIEIISGVTAEGKYFYASTGSIHPMYMGDNVYYKLYIKQPDGSYIYSNLMSYNAVTYANSVLANKHSTDSEKALMLALLNYGAEAQLYYGYKTDSLVNSHLTMGQMSKLEDYRADMAQGVTNLDSTKTGDFTKTATGTILYPTADFSHDLFTLNINCMTAKKIDGDITLYYWDEETVSGVDELTAENASGVLTMVRNDNGTYTAQIDGISAKDMSDTIYVSAVYSSNGAACCTGVTAYSVAELCKLHAEKDSSSMQDLAQAAIVFGYYANACFNN